MSGKVLVVKTHIDLPQWVEEEKTLSCSGVPRGGGGSGCSSTPISLLLNAAIGLRNSVLYAIQ